MPDLRTIRYVQEKLCTWYREYGRDLPWRRTRDPYAILVSEIMLQQTQVDRVIPKYHTFLKTFPTFRELAKASRAKVIHLWVGLGYNSRAVRLHELATTVAECHKGRLPRELKQLEALPGIRPYTARAVRSFAYHEQETVQDTNIRRVLARLYFGKNPSAVAKRILEHTMVKTELPGKSSMWYQSLMDFGALVCTSAAPKCTQCPLRSVCTAYPTIREKGVQGLQGRVVTYAQSRFKGSHRYWRGKIVAMLCAQKSGRSLNIATLHKRLENAKGSQNDLWLQDLLGELQRDGLITLNGRQKSCWRIKLAR